MISAAYPPHPSGEAYFVERLVEDLRSKGAMVSLLLGGSACDEPQAASVGDWTWRAVPRILRELRRRAPRVVLLHYTSWQFEHPMITWLPLLVKWFCPSTQFVTLFHNAVGVRRQPIGTLPVKGSSGSRIRWLRRRHGRLMHESDLCLTLTRWHESELRQLFPHSRVPVRQLPVFSFREKRSSARSFDSQKWTKPEGEFWVGFYGYVCGGKNYEDLVKGFALFARGRPQVRLAIVGRVVDPEAYRRLESLLKDQGVLSAVTFIGDSGEADSPWTDSLESMDVLVLPFEGGVSERRSSYAACRELGLPIVTTQGWETPAEFLGHSNVFHYREGDWKAMAACLTSLERTGPRSRPVPGELPSVAAWSGLLLEMGKVGEAPR